MKTLKTTLLFLLTLAAPTGAQCLMPDNLDSAPCCTPVDLALPTLPSTTIGALGIRWDACSIFSQTCETLSIGAPNPSPQCGHFTSFMSVDDCAGVALLSGVANLDYTRTWTETTGPAGPDYQVWRFALKADLSATAGAPLAANVPPCLSLQPSAFYYGYIDYALNCATGTIESAVVLYHGCDDFQHQPGLSSRPGVYHPLDSYAIAGPHTAADPFIPAVLPPSGGVLLTEAMRDAVSSFPDICSAEEPLVQGSLLPIAQVCICPISFNFPLQHTVSRLDGSGVCGGSFASLNVWPTVPWYEMVTTAIGRWATASYPGPETAAVMEGLVFYNDVCSSSGVVQTSLDILYGGQTTDGFTVVPADPTLPAPRHFLDVASNYSSPFPGPITLPIFGSVGPTEHLIYVNAF